MDTVSGNPDFKIGTILKAARMRAGKKTADIAKAVGGSARMVRYWERDVRGPGQGYSTEQLENLFRAYSLTKTERDEVIRRIRARKEERAGEFLSSLRKNKTLPAPRSPDHRSIERQVLAQLLDLPADGFKWVLETANAIRALQTRPTK